MRRHRRQRAVRRLVAPLVIAAALVSQAQGLTWAATPHRHLSRHRPRPGLGKSVDGTKALSAAGAATPVSSRTQHVTPVALPASGQWNVSLAGRRTSRAQTRSLVDGGVSAAVRTSWSPLGRSGIQVAGATRASKAATTSAPVRAVAAEIVSGATRKAFGLNGITLRLTRRDGGKAAAPIAVSIPDQLLAGLYGADYRDRVRWVQLPASRPGSAATEHEVKPVATARSGSATILTPTVTSSAVMLAATTTSGSATGSFAASTLKPSSSWQVSAQTGGFAWTYPMQVPPPAAGPTPGIGLSYDSQAVDGETGSTNNQPDEVGDGWSLSGMGFIERSYTSCAQDDGATGPVTGKYDLCWGGDNATLSMDGHSGRLIKVNSTTWRLQNDDGTRIEHLVGSTAGCGNTTYDDDCWRITTPDGTQYWFGRNELPNWVSGDATTNSAWTVPVFGNDPGEPGYNGDGTHAGTFATEAKTQAWRWNLDYVVDPNGNSEDYWYKAESNDYRENNTTVVAYTRGGYLDHINYGIRAGAEYTANSASDRVLFGQDTYGRCDVFGSTRSTSCTSETTETKPTTPSNYPDTPWDQYCTATCTGLVSPTFWSAQMLDTITTQYWNANASTPAFQTVDTWTLSHSFPANGEDSLKNAPAEWLTQVVQSAGSLSQTTSFAGLPKPNRVDDSQGLAELWKYRLTQITNDTGAITTVDYSDYACDGASNPLSCGDSLRDTIHSSPQTNTSLVYPQFWTPPQSSTGTPQEDIFNKYVVTEVDVDPHTGGAMDAQETTDYVYTGQPAWRFDTSAGTPDEDRTWSDYAGYDTVEVRVGDPNSPLQQQTTDYTFFQGLDGDPNGSPHTPTSSHRSASVEASDNTSVTDSLWWAGQARETITRVGANGGAGASTTPILSDTITTPWASSAKATWSYSYDTTDPTSGVEYQGTLTASAYLTGTATSAATTPLSTGGSRTVTTSSSFDDTYGLTTQVQTTSSDLGSTCTTTTYAENTTAYLIDFPKEVTKVGAACGASVDYSTVPASDTKTYYDSLAFGTAPTKGNVTQTDEVTAYSGSTVGTANWITASKTTYDALGRPLNVTDSMGQVTQTAYTPAATASKTGPLTSTVVTNPSPFLWKTTTAYDARWGAPTSITDPNSHVTSGTYDAMGRLTGVWLPDRPQATYPSAPSTGYAYTVSRTAASSITTTALNANGGTITSYSLYDGLGRPRQTQAPSEARNPTDGTHTTAGTIVTDTGYDGAGRVNVTNTAYYTPSVNPSTTLFNPSTTLPGQLQTTYDGAGRPTANIQFIDGTEAWRTSISYSGADRTDSTPPAGGTPTSTFTNSAGTTSKLVQYLSSGTSGTPEATTYGYDQFGRNTSMTNAGQEQWHWSYDALGRKVSATDPDTGTTTTSYNNDGSVASTNSPTGTLKYTYDHLGRKTSETNGSGNVLAAWDYDPTYGTTQIKGQLADTKRNVTTGPTSNQGTYTSAVTGYDADDRPTGTSLTLPATVATEFGLPTTGASYTTGTTYNADGSIATAQDLTAAGGLPAETLTSHYTNLGNLYALNSNKTALLGDVSYTHTNQLAQLNLTNGVTEVDRTYSYQDGSNRLTELSSITSATTGFHAADDTYSYNNAGAITADTQTADGVATDTQCYRYDQLQDLTDAWTPTSGDCTTDPDSGTLGGPDPYWTSYGIDPATGNRQYTIEHATVAGGTDTKDAYTYPDASSQFTNNNGGANAVETITHATAPAGSDPSTGTWTPSGIADQFTYNPDGSTSGLTGQTLAYNAEGRLSSTTITTGPDTGTTQDNVYDADGNLLLQSDPATGTTLFLSDTELHLGTDGSRTGTRTYTANGVPIAERSSDSTGKNTINWLCASPNGTSNLELNSTNLAPTRRYEDPYGNPRTGSPTTWSSTHDYLNHPTDTFTGNVQLGARVYSPVLGRFLSVDPQLNPADPQSINGYAYANNDPVNGADPSGLCYQDSTTGNYVGTNCGGSNTLTTEHGSGNHAKTTTQDVSTNFFEQSPCGSYDCTPGVSACTGTCGDQTPCGQYACGGHTANPYGTTAAGAPTSPPPAPPITPPKQHHDSCHGFWGCAWHDTKSVATNKWVVGATVVVGAVALAATGVGIAADAAVLGTEGAATVAGVSTETISAAADIATGVSTFTDGVGCFGAGDAVSCAGMATNGGSLILGRAIVPALGGIGQLSGGLAMAGGFSAAGAGYGLDFSGSLKSFASGG